MRLTTIKSRNSEFVKITPGLPEAEGPITKSDLGEDETEPL